MKAIRILCLLAMVMSGVANAALTEISSGNLLGDNTTLDFEAGTPGPIGNTDSLFTNFGFSEVSLVGTFSGSDNWDSGTDGNGLASVGGALSIVAPNQTFQNVDLGAGFSFKMAGTVTQFGFQLIDQAGNATTVETYLNGVLVDSLPYTPQSPFPISPQFYESSQPIDEFRVTDVNGGGGWGLDNIVLAGIAGGQPQLPAQAIPTLGDFARLMLILLFASVAVLFIRRKSLT